VSQQHYFYRGLFGLVGIFILTALGCSGLSGATSNLTPGVPAALTSTPTAPTATFTPTIAPTLTPTITPAPPNIPLSTAILTWTPVPTLPPAEALEALLKLYADNGGCQLPCWWGITPGKTSWQEARTKLSRLGHISRPFGGKEVVRYEFSFVIPAEIDSSGSFEPDIGVKDDIVVGISLNSRWVRGDFDYSLAGWLQVWGTPGEIWLKVVTTAPSEIQYEMDLFYPAKGILLNVTGIAQAHGDSLSICPQTFKRDIFPPALVLWSPSKNITYQTMFSDLLGKTIVDQNKFSLLEKLTDNFGPGDFYETYRDPKATACFDIQRAKLP
jgi:hypothetical protein